MRTNRFFGFAAAALAASTMLAGGASAGDNTTLTDALKNGEGYVKLRYRYENVDDDAFAKDANASTLRTKIGYTTGKFASLQGTIELENVSPIGGNEAYNDTLNGKVAYPTVADPQLSELNQAYLDFSGIDSTLVRVGRQLVSFDNERYIGHVDWRQNDMTHDAAAIINSSIPNLTLVYAFVSNVNTTSGSNIDATTHLFNAAYAMEGVGKLTVYNYLLDMENIALASLETNSTGIRFDGGFDLSSDTRLLLEAEYARQSDAKDNPTSYDVDYYHIAPGVSYAGLTAKLGYEVLGSDNNGTVAFQTPLATTHKFNGWADKFSTTPAAGLEDAYVSLAYAYGDSEVSATYHNFSSDFGSTDYGDEIDLSLTHKYDDTYKAGLYFASFSADNASGYTDTQKVYLVLGADF